MPGGRRTARAASREASRTSPAHGSGTFTGAFLASAAVPAGTLLCVVAVVYFLEYALPTRDVHSAWLDFACSTVVLVVVHFMVVSGVGAWTSWRRQSPWAPSLLRAFCGMAIVLSLLGSWLSRGLPAPDRFVQVTVAASLCYLVHALWIAVSPSWSVRWKVWTARDQQAMSQQRADAALIRQEMSNTDARTMVELLEKLGQLEIDTPIKKRKVCVHSCLLLWVSASGLA